MHRINNIFKVHENTACGFWAKISYGVKIFSGANMRLKHHVELPHFPKRSATFGAFLSHLIGAEAPFAFFTLYEWVGKPGNVPACLPRFWVHQNSGVNTIHIITLSDKFPPPK